MSSDAKFKKLVDAGHPVGEVIATEGCLVHFRGLEGASLGAAILYEDGGRGLVRVISPEKVTVLNLASGNVPVGMVGVIEEAILSIGAGDDLIGRAISPLGGPIDGGRPPLAPSRQSVFAKAPGLGERQLLDEQLVTGVSVVDLLFPIVLGQRIAILGDSKSGKSTFLRQTVINQKDTNRVVVYCLIAQPRIKINQLMAELKESGAIKHTIVVSDGSVSLGQSYLAPYAACAIAEYFWKNGRDCIIIYDDLSSHAKIYREISLLSRTSPGRDSYPGDMFFAHSSLLERAGKLLSTGRTLTAIPVVSTSNNDLTSYLATNIMSITDGQIIFDLEHFHRGIKPAVNVGLSVSRVGNRTQNKLQATIAQQVAKKLADWRRAEEFSHFSSELAPETRQDLELGKLLYQALSQKPNESYTIAEQLLLLGSVLAAKGRTGLDMTVLKQAVRQFGTQSSSNFESLTNQLLHTASIGASNEAS